MHTGTGESASGWNVACSKKSVRVSCTKIVPVKFYYYLVLLVMMPFILGAHFVHRFGPFGERDES